MANDTKTAFKCDGCGKCFSTEMRLKSHEKKHVFEKPYKCSYCRKSFALKEHLEEHEAEHRREKPFKCSICERRFVKRTNLIKHEISHTRDVEKPYQCSRCWRRFCRERDLAIHEFRHVARSPYLCDICNTGFVTKDQLKKHQRGHPEKAPHVCEVCQQPFMRKQNLEFHMRTHMIEKPYKCSTCGKCFAENAKLKRHVETHSKDQVPQMCDGTLSQGKQIPQLPLPLELFTCYVCEKPFPQTQLVAHLQTHAVEKPYKCTTCGKEFTKKSLLRAHEKIHIWEKLPKCDTCEKPFVRKVNFKLASASPKQCFTCGKCFSNSSNLKKHILTYACLESRRCSTCRKAQSSERLRKPMTKAEYLGEQEPFDPEKLHKCDLCDRRYTRRDHLLVHMQIHSGERPFGCDICGKRFIRMKQLKEHENIHTRRRLYSCDVCEKTYTRKDHLSAHRMIHTGERPFKCDKCGKGFTRRIQLTNHEVIHAEDKPFKCTSCDRDFSQKYKFEKHQKSHARELSNMAQRGEYSEGKGLFEIFKNEPIDQPSDTCSSSKSSIDLFTEQELAEMLYRSGSNERFPLFEPLFKDQEIGLGKCKSGRLHHEDSNLLIGSKKNRSRKIRSKTSFSLPEDLKELKAKEEILRKCDTCDECFSSLEQLKDHQEMHAAKKNYQPPASNKDCLSVDDQLGEFKPNFTEEMPYKCDICRMRFSLLKQLKEHKLNHIKQLFLTKLGKHEPEEMSYKCNFCETSFSVSQQLKEHVCPHSELQSESSKKGQNASPIKKAFKCSICHVSFNFLQQLKEHESSHKGQTVLEHLKECEPTLAEKMPYACSSCEASFPLSPQLKEHKLIHDSEVPLTDVPTEGPLSLLKPLSDERLHKCDSHLLDAMRLKGHKLSHSVEPHYKFISPGECFSMLEQLKNQDVIFSEEMPYKCDIGNESFTHLGELSELDLNSVGCSTDSAHLKHSEVPHTNQALLKCDSCDECFLSLEQQAEHEDACGISAECFSLTEQFKKPETGVQGLLISESFGERLPCSDQLSDLKFSGVKRGRDECIISEQLCAALDQKNVTHLLFKCNFCEERFSQKEAVSEHEATHCKEMCYSYEDCFSLIEQLQRRETSHTKEMPFKCDSCEECFSSLQQLKRHKKEHSREFHINCDTSEKYFSILKHLKEHGTTRMSFL